MMDMNDFLNREKHFKECEMIDIIYKKLNILMTEVDNFVSWWKTTGLQQCLFLAVVDLISQNRFAYLQFKA